MFRPEMLLPMGLPEDVNVAGYGLSLERYGCFQFKVSFVLSIHTYQNIRKIHPFYQTLVYSIL